MRKTLSLSCAVAILTAATVYGQAASATLASFRSSPIPVACGAGGVCWLQYGQHPSVKRLENNNLTTVADLSGSWNRDHESLQAGLNSLACTPLSCYFLTTNNLWLVYLGSSNSPQSVLSIGSTLLSGISSQPFTFAGNGKVGSLGLRVVVTGSFGDVNGAVGTRSFDITNANQQVAEFGGANVVATGVTANNVVGVAQIAENCHVYPASVGITICTIGDPVSIPGVVVDAFGRSNTGCTARQDMATITQTGKTLNILSGCYVTCGTNGWFDSESYCQSAVSIANTSSQSNPSVVGIVAQPFAVFTMASGYQIASNGATTATLTNAGMFTLVTNGQVVTTNLAIVGRPTSLALMDDGSAYFTVFSPSDTKIYEIGVGVPTQAPVLYQTLRGRITVLSSGGKLLFLAPTLGDGWEIVPSQSQ